MPSLHDRCGKIQQSASGTRLSNVCSIRPECRSDLTYVEHNPSRRTSTLGDVHGARIGRIGNDGENFALKADRRAMEVLGFESFAVDFGERMAGEG